MKPRFPVSVYKKGYEPSGFQLLTENNIEKFKRNNLMTLKDCFKYETWRLLFYTDGIYTRKIYS